MKGVFRSPILKMHNNRELVSLHESEPYPLLSLVTNFLSIIIIFIKN